MSSAPSPVSNASQNGVGMQNGISAIRSPSLNVEHQIQNSVSSSVGPNHHISAPSGMNQHPMQHQNSIAPSGNPSVVQISSPSMTTHSIPLQHMNSPSATPEQVSIDHQNSITSSVPPSGVLNVSTPNEVTQQMPIQEQTGIGSSVTPPSAVQMSAASLNPMQEHASSCASVASAANTVLVSTSNISQHMPIQHQASLPSPISTTPLSMVQTSNINSPLHNSLPSSIALATPVSAVQVSSSIAHQMPIQHQSSMTSDMTHMVAPTITNHLPIQQQNQPVSSFAAVTPVGAVHQMSAPMSQTHHLPVQNIIATPISAAAPSNNLRMSASHQLPIQHQSAVPQSIAPSPFNSVQMSSPQSSALQQQMSTQQIVLQHHQQLALPHQHAHGPQAASPVPQLQVIQHPLQNSSYVHQIYAAGPHGTQFMLPGNLTIHPANMSAATLQSIGVAQAANQSRGLATALPQTSIDLNKQPTATIMPSGVASKVMTCSVSGANLVQAASQFQVAGSVKTSGSQLINAAALPQASKSIYAGQQAQCSYTIPCSSTTVNGQQTFVIGQLGVLPAGTQHASAVFSAKPGDPNHKHKSFTMGIRSPLHPAGKVMSGTFQSKSPILPHPNVTTAAVFSGTHFKQLNSNSQLVASSQGAAAVLPNQTQIIGSLQAAAFGGSGQVAQGVSWAAAPPGCIQSPTMIAPNAQILIRGNPQDMFFQSAAAPHQAFQAIAQPQIQQVPSSMITSSTVSAAQSSTPVASVVPSSTTTVTSASTQRPVKQLPEQSAVLPKVSSAVSNVVNTVTTTLVTNRNLSTILPASNSMNVIPMAQVRPASASGAVQTSPNKQVMQNKQKVRPRLSPGASGIVQGHVRATLNTIGQKMERQTQTLPIQPKQRMPTLVRPTTVAQRLTGISIATPVTVQPRVMTAVTQVVAPTTHVATPAIVGGNVATCSESVQEVPTSVASAISATASAITTPSMSKAPTVSTVRTIPQSQPIMLPQIPQAAKTNVIVTTSSAGGNVNGENKENVQTAKQTVSVTTTTVVDSNCAPVMIPAPRLGENKSADKQPQKAIVKPNVLTHFIDGFVILESSEPFPVNRSSPVLSASNNHSHETNNEGDPKFVQQTEVVCCEFCKKSGLRSVFPGSKRFCSKSCAKRYNVGCSERVGMFKSDYGKKRKTAKEDEISKNDESIDKSNKSGEATPEPPLLHEEVMGARGNDCSTMPEIGSGNNGSASNNDQPPTLHPAAAATSFAPTLTPHDCYSSCYNKNPVKWTVQEVYEFIKSLPGCTDYAEEFLSQEIDGQALLLLKGEHLVTTMNVKLGPALKILSKVSSLQKEFE